MRTFLLVSPIFLCLFCLAGCGSQTTLTPTLPATHAPTQEQVTIPQPASTQTATLIPSNTPTCTPVSNPTETSSATPTPQLQVLDFPSNGLRLALPAGYRWVKYAVTGDLLLSVGIKLVSDTTSGYTLPPIGLRIFQKPEEVRLIDWFSGKQGDCYEIGGQPAPGAFFIAPMIKDQADFQGMPALRYESGCWPTPSEILIDRGRLVIGLFYLQDYPINLQADYVLILASLEFFELPTPTVATTTPTPTATVCLDEGAAPLAVPTPRSPLEVRFISDGNLWVWKEGETAQQISATGDAMRFTFSPDGKVIVFERPMGDYPFGNYKFELWAINRDGEGLRKLVSVEQFDAFLPERERAWVANVPGDYHWIPGAHQLSFGVGAYVRGLGGGSGEEGYWKVDADTLALEKWTNPETADLSDGNKIASPDGKLIAILDTTSISLLNADGSLIRSDALTYPAFQCYSDGPCAVLPEAFWTPDSRFLRVLVWDVDALTDNFSTWELPADGSPAQQLHAFDGIYNTIYISPDQENLAYLRRAQPMSNNLEIHLAKFDGSRDVIYTGDLLYFQGWSPDSYHFVLGLADLSQPFLGSLCGGAVPLVDASETPATRITWVDANRFLFVSGEEGQPRQLRLGQVGGASILIGPFNGDPDYDTTYYEIKPDQ
jgi:hypothetical protein